MKVANIKSAFDLLVREGVTVFIHKLLWYSKGRPVLEKSTAMIFPVKEPDSNSASWDYSNKISLPNNKVPLVSIIIPAHNGWAYTYACIQSIVKYTQSIDYEIIVGDDNSNDDTINADKTLINLKITRSNKNVGITQVCNDASKIAKGKYLMFLGNRTLVTRGWLDYLVKTIEDEHVVMVGSQIIDSKGKLHFAGGLVDNTGLLTNFGIGQDPRMSEYNYLKEVDYVSSSAMLIDRTFWQETGGFCLSYVNLKYEGVDLAFQARQNGYKVIYQPKSILVEYTDSIGRDKTLEQTAKSINECQAIFIDKWYNALKKQFNGTNNGIFLNRDRSQNKKHILVIDRHVPLYDKDAGSHSTYSYVCLFIKMGYSVSFIGDDFHYRDSYTSNLQQLGVEVIYGDYYKKNIEDWIRTNSCYFTHVFTHRLEVTPKYLDLLKIHTSAKILYVGHDLHFEKYKKLHLQTNKNEHLYQSKEYYSKEVEIFQAVDSILPFSTYEAEVIRNIAPEKEVLSIPVYFYENIPKVENNFEKREDLLFVGGFDLPSNVDAILWFAIYVFPLVLKEIPACKLHVVGSNPTRQILKLKSDSIFVAGYVSSEELSKYYKTCKISVIPLLSGAGVKGKLIEAFYNQLPTVITSIAAEGIPEIENYAIITNNETEFAEKIIILYKNKNLWEHYSKMSKEIIEKYFSEKAATKLLNGVMNYQY